MEGGSIIFLTLNRDRYLPVASMRVVGGTARGRRLRSPQGRGVRPTTDRVRGAIFNILGFVENFVAADLYAGTGSLGIEVLSRNGRRVDFVEADPRQCWVIRTNLESVGFAGQGRVLCKTVEEAIENVDGMYDLILMDPPYSLPYPGHVLEGLSDIRGLLHESSRVVVGHSNKVEPGSSYGRLVLEQDRRYGDTAVAFYRVGGQE